jgi:hypothetical protein
MSWRKTNFTTALHQALFALDRSEQTDAVYISVERCKLKRQFVWMGRRLNVDRTAGCRREVGKPAAGKDKTLRAAQKREVGTLC